MSLASMVDGHGAALGEGDAVAHFDAVLHDLHNLGHVVILLNGSQDSLNGFDVGVQFAAPLLELLDTLLVLSEFVPYIFVLAT